MNYHHLWDNAPLRHATVLRKYRSIILREGGGGGGSHLVVYPNRFRPSQPARIVSAPLVATLDFLRRSSEVFITAAMAIGD